MANMKGPRFKQCRRLGLNVVGHPKAMKRAKPGTSRDDRKLSDYGKQLLEKQRLKAYYGVLEKQFKRYVEKAKKSSDITGDALVISLECRLDNMVYRMGFANSIRQARQMVSHGHIVVNSRKVDIPSFGVSLGDEISLTEKSRSIPFFKDNFKDNLNLNRPYISKDENNLSAKLVKTPNRIEIPIEINDHLVVEYYS